MAKTVRCGDQSVYVVQRVLIGSIASSVDFRLSVSQTRTIQATEDEFLDPKTFVQDSFVFETWAEDSAAEAVR